MSAENKAAKLKPIIEEAFKQKNPQGAAAEIKEAIRLLDEGQIQTAQKREGKWQTLEWVKQAILLYFGLQNSRVTQSGPFSFFDKIPLKKWTGQEGVRVVPQALARYGSFVEKGAVLMPSYINIGARVGEGSLIDTWATVGSCAQVGKYVHVSGGAGLGGVLEPLQALPVIIEDHAFIGSRCILVEGVIVEEGAVLGAGVVITASSPIIDVTGDKEKIHKGVVPKNCVVIPGTRRKKFPSGEYDLPCALIIGQRSASTDRKTSLNEALRQLPS